MKTRARNVLVAIFGISMIGPLSLFLLPYAIPSCNELCTSLVRALLYLCFLLAGISALILLATDIVQKKYSYLSFMALLIVNPLFHPFYMEPLDDHMNYRLRDKAVEHGIVGMTPDQVRAAMGKPDKIIINSQDYIEWDYKPLPFYWLGSKLQVFFRDGTVSSIDPNDD